VAGEGGAKAGDSMQNSRDWKDLFETELDRLARTDPFRPDVEQWDEMAG